MTSPQGVRSGSGGWTPWLTGRAARRAALRWTAADQAVAVALAIAGLATGIAPSASQRAVRIGDCCQRPVSWWANGFRSAQCPPGCPRWLPSCAATVLPSLPTRPLRRRCGDAGLSAEPRSYGAIQTALALWL